MSKLTWLIIFGILIRITLSSVTFHPDIRALDLGGKILASGNIANFYDYLASLPRTDILTKSFDDALFIYPPAIYFFHSIFNLLFGWLFDEKFMTAFLTRTETVLGTWQLTLHLLVMKLPYLIFDLLSAFLISKLFISKREQQLAFLLWLFNPVSIYATYLMGQFDIIPTFFVILSLFFVTKQRLSLSAISLGIGAAFKIFPLFLLIPLLSLTKSYTGKIKLLLLGILPYVLTIMPYLFSRGFRSSALVAGQTLKSFYAQIPVSGGEAIILFLAALIFFYFVFFFRRDNGEYLWSRFFIILLLFFIFTHYHPQWFVWLTPFLILDLIHSGFKHLALILLTLFSFVGLLFFFDPSLTLGIFSPLWPNLYTSQSLWQILHLKMDFTLSRSILQTFFVGAAAYYIFYYFPKERE